MFRQRKSSGTKYSRQTTKSRYPKAKGVTLPARDARNGMAPYWWGGGWKCGGHSINSQRHWYTRSVYGQGTCLGRLIILLLLFLVREKLSVYVHNCVIDDFSILKFIKKFLLLMKWVFYELYHVFYIFYWKRIRDKDIFTLPLVYQWYQRGGRSLLCYVTQRGQSF